MKFEIETKNRNIPDQDLLDDLISIAKSLKKDSLTYREYNKHGKYSSGLLSGRFGSWPKACQLSGLNATNFRNIPDEELLADIQNVASKNETNKLTTRQYEKQGSFKAATLISRFGNWDKACQLAGLNTTMLRDIPEDSLFENLEDVWQKLGRQPRYREMKKPLSKFSAASYAFRYGSWIKALETFIGNVETVSEPIEVQQSSSDNKLDTGESLKHKTKRSINYRIRFLVLRRDNFKCIACGRSPAIDQGIILHIDHIIAWDKGGETVIENLQTLCSVCNIGKSNLDFTISD